MSIVILKDGVRVAMYHCKRTNSRKHVRGILAFYKALYAGTGAHIESITIGV
jgi:hypothetical protein